MNSREHWDRHYASRPDHQLGWYEPHLRISLEWIDGLGLTADAPIIDAGGGASTLVDDLLDRGYRALTVADLSAEALSRVKARLGERAGQVTWHCGDMTTMLLSAAHYALWHDRAVFHFLTTADAQQRYRNQLLQALAPDGHLILATFAPEAPPRCSGLPVQRYDPQTLEKVLGKAFGPIRYRKQLHLTPGGIEQMYLYSLFRRSP
ncbi:MAG: class I SAM-dependent methyltransferase [Candidatus Competibacterales bacterium]|nr:class I SAM-dependent methyltransferase [Candidatus Competibacterales bacterium]